MMLNVYATKWAVVLAVALGSAAYGSLAARAEEAPPESNATPAVEDKTPLHWHDDYRTAVNAAIESQRMLVVLFDDAKTDSPFAKFAGTVLNDSLVEADLRNYELARLPLDARATIQDEEVRLLDHAAFKHMHGRPGLVIIDFTDADSPLYKHVVTVFPFMKGRTLDVMRTQTLLNLPAGTLTQRTLIYAVRTHPENPGSADGEFDPLLAHESEKHSVHQASIRLQGHHNWDSRFHKINARLPGELTPTEVCAESWPGETLVEAAEECVHSWRQSSGHWRAVRGNHRLFGYDMKLGRNGIWYATGIFGQRGH